MNELHVPRFTRTSLAPLQVRTFREKLEVMMHSAHCSPGSPRQSSTVHTQQRLMVGGAEPRPRSVLRLRVRLRSGLRVRTDHFCACRCVSREGKKKKPTPVHN